MSYRHTSPFNHGPVKSDTNTVSGVIHSGSSSKDLFSHWQDYRAPILVQSRLPNRGQIACRKDLGPQLTDPPLKRPGRTLNWIKLFRFNLPPSGGKGMRVSLACSSSHYADNRCSPGLIWVLIFNRVASQIWIITKSIVRLL